MGNLGIVSGGTKDFCDYFTLHNLHSVYFCYLIFIEPKFYWETQFFFTSFFEIRKLVKSFWAKFSTSQRKCGHNFCFWGEIFTPDTQKVTISILRLVHRTVFHFTIFFPSMLLDNVPNSPYQLYDNMLFLFQWWI